MALVVIDGNQRVFRSYGERDLVITFARSWIRSCVLLPSQANDQ